MPAPGAPAAADEREYLHLQTTGLPPADLGTPAALQRSFSARSDRTVDMSMDMSHDDMTFAGLSDCDEVEAVQPTSGAPVAQAVRHGRRAGRPAAEELAEETLDLSASFDQLDTSQLDMEEPVRRSTRPGAALQQLARGADHAEAGTAAALLQGLDGVDRRDDQVAQGRGEEAGDRHRSRRGAAGGGWWEHDK